MRNRKLALLAAACGVLLGCSSQPPPAPAAMSDAQKAAVAEEDAKVRAEESQRK